MHAGQFETLHAVLAHYRSVSGTILADENFHAELTEQDAIKIEAFLSALTALEAK
ncbi:MAG: hypothetical protein GJ676_14270 [Rhodobacteraceae bacterium]|nr:hypothetical protein [Paracoccaceae bacterium]